MQQLWGKTDDGFFACIHVPPIWTSFDEAVSGGWWPPMGLTYLGDESSVDPSNIPNCSHFGLLDREQRSFDELESDLGLFVAEHLTSHVAIHAALISDGVTTIVFPGRSMSGKTSLCAAALDLGLIVLSDEYALIDPITGLARGWPRRLRVRVDGGAVRVRLPDHDASHRRVDLVAHLRFDATVDDQRPLDVSSMTEGDTAMCLLDNTICAKSRPAFALDGVLAVARTASGLKGKRGDARRTLGALF